MAIANVAGLHVDLNEWYKTLQFYADEIKAFEKQLVEVVNNNTHKEILAEAEHFQNQFILQKEQLDLLQHDVHEQEIKVKADVVSESLLVNVPVANEQDELKSRVQMAGKIFEETKTGFHQFLSRVL